jgi:hypothetical protein
MSRLALLLASLLLASPTAPSAVDQAEHHLYLANAYFFAGDVASARAELAVARGFAPAAEVPCAGGLRLAVQIAGDRVALCDPERAHLPERVEAEVLRALVRGDLAEVRRLDPFRLDARPPALWAGVDR